MSMLRKKERDALRNMIIHVRAAALMSGPNESEHAALLRAWAQIAEGLLARDRERADRLLNTTTEKESQ
jgi:hypothetical protein